MSRFRALLLGVAEYDDSSITSLPCVTSDIDQLATAFEARGYTVEGTESSGRIGRTRVRGTVRKFLETAKPEDTLVIYLSGHGAYHEGVTYLIPTDADLSDDMEEMAVSLSGWTRAIEDSKAAAVLFLVDACREGYAETKSVTRDRWSADKTWRAQRRQVAWIFPCAEGQVSRWVQADGAEVFEPFSLFARALVGALSNPAAPRTLDGLADSLQANMAELTRKHKKPDQSIRVVTNGRDRTEPFRLFPDGTREAQTWEQAAAGHLVWQRIPQTPENQALADNVVSLVRHLDRLRQRAATVTSADPWAERGGFALRMSRELSFLLSSMLSELSLSPAEAALLAAAPFVYEAHWARQLAESASLLETDGVPPTGPLRTSFDRYVQGFPRLRRWAGNLDGHPALAWWLLHRWLSGQPGAYADNQVAELLDPDAWGGGRLATEVLSPERLRLVVRAIREANGFFAVDSDLGGLSPEFTVAEGRPGEQPLRERLVAILLAVAHRMAIEAPFLPDVIPDTLGTPDPVVAGDLRVTLDEASWGKAGQDRIRVLAAACTHPAVEIALREYVAEFDGLLTHLQAQARQPGLGALGGLPFRALADRVRPAVRDGKPAYDSAGTRFRLAEDKVQELLMGEQLYGRATAAIRELYQNALDACRYRKARTEYLNRTGHPTSPWTGSIRFVRDRDENGRDYLDCIDNGIGMGRRELSEVFARAGVRFAELPEFLEEKHEWDKLDPPVELIPNSRFGVGVLSYFMMADEISIDTCRFGRNGQPGERLQVSIAGPGSLFRIQSAGPGQESGTTVRLYLNPGSAADSCADELRQWLKVAEFMTEVIEDGDREEWKPGVLTGSKGFEPTWDKALSAGGAVWWVRTRGALLVDGIKADSGAAFDGAVVNLTGEHVRLSVDRKQIISLSEQVLDDRLRAALPMLLTEGRQLLRVKWLWRLAQDRPAVAEWLLPSVLEQEMTRSPSFGSHFDLAVAQCFYADAWLLMGSRWLTEEAGSVVAEVGDVPDEIAAWRFASLMRAGVTISGMRADSLPLADKHLSALSALPSDCRLLLINDPGYESEWLERDAPVPAGHVFEVAEALHRPVPDVCDRLRLLGYTVPDEAALLTDRMLASINLDGKAPWRKSTSKLTAKEITFISERLAVDDVEIAERLRRLGYDASPVVDTVLANEAIFAWNSWVFNGASWLSPGDWLGARQVLLAARELGLGVAEVVGRYGDLGFDVADAVGSLELMTLDAGGGKRLWEIGRGRIRREWVSRAAGQLGMSADEATRRLRAEGFVVLDATPGSYLDEAIVGEIGQDHQREQVIFYSQSGSVKRGEIIECAVRSGQQAACVAADLRALGFEVPSVNNLGVVDDELQRMCAESSRTSSVLWSFDDRPVPMGAVMDVASDIGRPVDYVAKRLRSAGYEVPDTASLTDEDRFLVSRDLDGQSPWLNDPDPVPVWHLARAAIKFDRDPRLIARRLHEFGYQVPEGWG